MTQYLRLKTDGFVYDYNAHLIDSGRFDVVEIEGPPPERIPDLQVFNEPKPKTPKRRIEKIR